MNFIKEIVSGKKKRTKDAGYNLDLTYICPRIIAMSFPAEGLETTFRNNINDVANFIKERHGADYYVYNLSGRKYSIDKFNNQVADFSWEDHHSPPIYTLFKLCKSIDEFLAKKLANIVAIHCLAGKGRTGTAICCYMIYSGRFQNTDDALAYYQKKRFILNGGVQQPSQKRYVHYFERILKDWRVTPVVKYITSVTLVGVPIFSKHSCRPYIEIYNVQERQFVKIYTDKKKSHEEQKKYSDLGSKELNIIKIQITSPFVVNGDVMIRVQHNGKFKDIIMFRIAFNTAFIPESNTLHFELGDLDPYKTKLDQRFPDYFMCEVQFSDYCECTNNTLFKEKCKECSIFMKELKPLWEDMHNIMKEYIPHSILESKQLMFGDPEFDDYNEILYSNQKSLNEQKQIEQDQEIYSDQDDEKNEENEKFKNENHHKQASDEIFSNININIANQIQIQEVEQQQEIESKIKN